MKNAAKLLTVFAILSSIILLSSCQKEADSKIKQEVINTAQLPALLEKMKADENFKKEDIDNFVLGMGRFNGKLDSLNGKTVQQVIDEEKDFLKKSSLVGLTNTFMNMIHGFGYKEWQPLEQNDQKFFTFAFAVQNKTKEDLKYVEGLLKFVTANNQLIKGFRVKIQQGVKNSAIQQFNSTFAFDPNNKNDVLLWELLTNKSPQVYTLWEPLTLEFNNGQKIVKETPLTAKK